jgi:hypothetical protein
MVRKPKESRDGECDKESKVSEIDDDLASKRKLFSFTNKSAVYCH